MIKRLTYKTFSGLADLQDFKDSGGSVSHRTEAGVRRLARIKRKLRNRFFKEHGYKPKKPSKCCPICGESKRRAGYYNACPDCYPTIQWREDIAYILGQLQGRMESEGVKLRAEFSGRAANIEAVLSIAPEFMAPHGEPLPRQKVIQFRAKQQVTMRDTDYFCGGLKEFIMHMVLNLYQGVLDKATQYVDKNGCVMTLGPFNVPAAGPWKNPTKPTCIESVPFPFTRSKKQ